MADIQNTQYTADQIATSWDGMFKFQKENETSKGLRSPQIGALHAIMAHLEEETSSNGIIVMPTGTGKTETMLSFMIANKCRKVFVVVPSDALRSQIFDKFKTLGLLPKIGVVPESIIRPKVYKVDKTLSEDEWVSVIQNNNVIISTMALASEVSNSTKKLLNQEISFLFVDEAHHSEAATWDSFISSFNKGKALLFTATPFRNDGQKLKGRIIFNFPLRKAQEQGYYKKISFLPVMEYTKPEADIAIAEKAVSQLKKDINNGYNHILMARCMDKKRANEVYKCYQRYKEFNPVIIYSGITNENKILEDIKFGRHQIVVCVNMLGEGFDLPQLKIAAIHDERQSLAITLQFIGRFTRVSDNSIGTASFITNLAYPPIANEINNLYQLDADWNSLLPRISEDVIESEVKLNDYIQEFHGSLAKEFSLQDIHPALSAEVFTTTSTTTNFSCWGDGLANKASYDVKLHASTSDMFVAVLGKSSNVQWGTVKNIKNMTWDIIVVYFDALNKRVYLNSSISLSGKNFLSHIFSDIRQFKGECVYRVFANTHRLRLFNVGARLHNGKDISFQSYFGSSVQDGMNELAQGRLMKNNLFGVGFRNGQKVSVGCSEKGKIWSRERTNLLLFKVWCNEVGSLISDTNIDTNVVLKNTLKPSLLRSFPAIPPISIDWSHEIYEHGNLLIKFGQEYVPFDDCNLDILDETKLGENIAFSLGSEKGVYKIVETIRTSENSECVYTSYSQEDEPIFNFCNTEYTIQEFFTKFVPLIYLADTSEIHGVNKFKAELTSEFIPNEFIIPIEWQGVNLSHESQGAAPYITDSIQYYFANLIHDKFDYIIDDDGSGEIADLIGINVSKHMMEISLFHLKYAIEGKVSDNINNLYQVCGQAQKSISWKYVSGNKFFDHILKRDQRKKKNDKSSSILKGSVEDLQRLKEQAYNKKGMQFKIFIVQPGMSKESATDSMRILLGNTYKFLRESANIPLKVICSQ